VKFVSLGEKHVGVGECFGGVNFKERRKKICYLYFDEKS